MDNTKLPDVFVSHAADILAETNSGLSGGQIVKYCNSYGVIDIPKGTQFRWQLKTIFDN